MQNKVKPSVVLAKTSLCSQPSLRPSSFSGGAFEIHPGRLREANGKATWPKFDMGRNKKQQTPQKH